MDRVLQPHQSYAAAYLDDVVVHSESWKEHLPRLREVLTVLHQAGLTVNPQKCHLGLSEARYLGYRIGKGLIEPQEETVKAIWEYPRPSTKKQVLAFLGLAGYYQCFILGFFSLACPLTDLTKKSQPDKVQWNAAAERAFRKLQTALISAAVLYVPDFFLPSSKRMPLTQA